MRDATVRHIRSALRRLPDGGRLVVLTGANHDPADAETAALYADLAERASFAFTASVDGRIYARHGTSIDTRLTVIDRVPPGPCPACPGRSRRQPRRPAGADRGEASAAAAIFFPSGYSGDHAADARRNAHAAAPANPFSPSGPVACCAGRGRNPL